MKKMEGLGVSLTGIAENIKHAEPHAEAHKEPVREEVTFPLENLPEWLQKTVKDHAEAYGTPSELWATAFLSGIAAAAGSKIKLVTGNYTNYPQLWVMIIGKSGDGKSDAGRVAFRRLGEIDKQNFVKYQSARQEWKENDGQGAAPRWEQLLINDTTPEALYKAMGYANNGLTLYRDELSGWFADFGRYNKSGEIGHYLSIFDNQNFSINRKGDEPALITNPLLTIYGTIQPAVLAEVLGKNNFETSGFAQRFMFVYPNFEKKKYQRTTTPRADHYEAIIDAILSPETEGTLQLSEEAESEYEKFFNDMEDLREYADDFWSAVYAKAHIQVLRLALTVKIARLWDENTSYIEAEDMRAAIGMQRYFIDSLERFKKERPSQGSGKKKTSDVIRDIYEVRPDASPTIIGELFGVSRQYAHKLRKVDRLTVDNTAKPLQEQDSGKQAVNLNLDNY